MTLFGARFQFRGLALICSLVIASGDLPVYGQSPQQAPPGGEQQEQSLNSQQLESLVSPVALYPDSLLAQILTASTYPLQIVTAARWVQQNANLKDKERVEAAGNQGWDASIQALVAFPTVLQMMDQSLAWTSALGNVFLAQQSDVMMAVQRMRTRAQQSGQLQSSAQQEVETTTVEGQPTTLIQPADEQVIYVPNYDPTVVYGDAPETSPYPKMIEPTDAVDAGTVSFGDGVAIGAIFTAGWGWGWGCHWGAHPSLYVNNDFFAHNWNSFANRRNWSNAMRWQRQGWMQTQPAISRPCAGAANGGERHPYVSGYCR
jgi:hypothetical protein